MLHNGLLKCLGQGIRGSSWSRMARMVSLSVSVVLLIAPTGAIVRRHDQPDSKYINLGNRGAFQAVGTLINNSLGTFCSATLIRQSWVLTAAHCVDFGTGNTAVTFTIGSTSRTSNLVVRHPGWTGSLSNGNDIALVRLSSPFPGITPANIYTGSGELGKAGFDVGFGNTGTGLTGFINGTAGTKRGMKNKIDAFGSAIGFNPNILLADFDNPNNPGDSTFGSTTPLALEGQIAPGDSGGPTFIKANQQFWVAGVHSFFAWSDGSPNADYGDLGGSTRVSAYADWITGTIGGVPEPASMVTLGAGLAGLAALRRRKQ